jgi:hypothetical protein
MVLYINLINEQYANQTNTVFELAPNIIHASMGEWYRIFKIIHVTVLKNCELSGTEDG